MARQGERNAETKPKGPIAPAPPAPESLLWRAIKLSIALAAAVVMILAVWSVPRQLGDLYVALAGGRDVFDGKIGKPDDWSFMNIDLATGKNRVWLNQNWGTHVAFYLSYTRLGEWGLLGLKAVMLCAIVLMAVLAARRRGVDWPVAIVVAAAILLSARSYVDLRPNLTSLVMAPLLLWLLYWSEGHVHRIWLAVGAVWLWSNVHGGFVFGLGMLAMWAACQLVIAMFQQGLAKTIRQYWPLLAAVVAAVLLAGLANPFGLVNLTHPFTMASGEEGKIWRGVWEWASIFELVGFGTTWEFVTVVGILVGLSIFRLWVEALVGRSERPPSAQGLGLAVFCLGSSVAVVYLSLAQTYRETQVSPVGARFVAMMVLVIAGMAALFLLKDLLVKRALADAPQLGSLVFTALLGTVAIAMAVKSRRFIPLALIVLAPMMAQQVGWLLRRLPKVSLPILAIACAIPGGMLLQSTSKVYCQDNPAVAGTVFQRMHHVNDMFPVQAARFIDDNGIAGRAFSDWKWEGFVHYYCPRLKLFVGGRAQQAYDKDAYRLGQEVVQSFNGTRILSDYDVHLLVVSLEDLYVQGQEVLLRLLNAPGSKWCPIFSDGWTYVYADGASETGAKLIRQALSGELKYPNDQTRATSFASALERSSSPPDARAVMKAWQEANRLCASQWTYTRTYTQAMQVLNSLADQQKGEFLADIMRYFQQEQARLEFISKPPTTELDLLMARDTIAAILADIYGRMGPGHQQEAYQANQNRARLDQLIKATREQWGN